MNDEAAFFTYFQQLLFEFGQRKLSKPEAHLSVKTKAQPEEASPLNITVPSREIPFNILLKRFRRVPSSYRVLTRLCDHLDDPLVSIDEIVTTVRTDAGVSSMVVSLSNTAFYSASTPTETLDEAIERVGYMEVVKIVSLICRSAYEDASLSPYGMNSDSMWQRSLTLAHLMEHLASRYELSTGQAYLIGLVQDIGRYPIAAFLEEIHEDFRVPDVLDLDGLLAWEADKVGHSHLEISVEMLRRMGFAENVVQPICPVKECKSGDILKMTVLLDLCRHLLPAILRPIERDSVLQSNAAAIQSLGLDIDELQADLSRVSARVDSTRIMVNSHLKRQVA